MILRLKPHATGKNAQVLAAPGDIEGHKVIIKQIVVTHKIREKINAFM